MSDTDAHEPAPPSAAPETEPASDGHAPPVDPRYQKLPPSALDEAGKPRFLIVRLSALGDVVHTLPVLHELRAAYPEAEIGWLVEDRFSDLLEGHPELTRLHVLPRVAWRELGFFRRLAAVREFSKELRGFGYTVALDVQSLAKSAYFAGKSGAPLRIGYAPPEGRELSGWFHTIRVSPGPHVKHVSERHLSLLVPLGITATEPVCVFPDLSKEVGELSELLEAAGERFFVVHAGSSWPSKQWPVDHFTAATKRIASELSMKAVLTGAGDVERSRAETVARDVGDEAMVTPDLTIRQLTALISKASLFIGGDTGPMHLAAAQGIPTVAVIGPTRGERNGPLGAHTRWTDAGLGCIGCKKRRCPDGTDACMRGVQPDEVFDLVTDVLGVRNAESV